MNERNYILVGAVGNVDYVEGCDGRFVLEVDRYLEVVEIYIMRLLVTTLNKMDLAISWIEKADLPEDRRQVKNNICIFFWSEPLPELIDIIMLHLTSC